MSIWYSMSPCVLNRDVVTLVGQGLLVIAPKLMIRMQFFWNISSPTVLFLCRNMSSGVSWPSYCHTDSIPVLTRQLQIPTEEPLRFTDPFLFMTDDTEETVRYSGLRQILILGENDNNALHGSRKRTFMPFVAIMIESYSPMFPSSSEETGPPCIPRHGQ